MPCVPDRVIQTPLVILSWLAASVGSLPAALLKVSFGPVHTVAAPPVGTKAHINVIVSAAANAVRRKLLVAVPKSPCLLSIRVFLIFDLFCLLVTHDVSGASMVGARFPRAAGRRV